MPVRRASAEWTGGLKNGAGKVKLERSKIEAGYSAGSRFEEADGTNPEELMGAAHAGCFSMALADLLEGAGYEPEWIRTTADVELKKVGEAEFEISRITLKTEARAPGADKDAFVEIANKAKKGCPVSKALKGVEISLEAELAEG
jgi:osmotically inducible protein OsmC